MADSLNILVIEDSQADFLLIDRHLKKHGVTARCQRVSDHEELEAAFVSGGWDVVFADYNVPRLKFEDGLALIRKLRSDLPILLISGSIGEEKAVELLRLGVWDFVLKDHLIRLVPVLERNLKDAAEYRARHAAEQALRESDERLRLTLEAAEVVAWDLNLITHEVRETGPVASIFGRPPGFHHGNQEGFVASVHPDDRERVHRELQAGIESARHGSFGYEFRVLRSDGRLCWLMTSANVVCDGSGRPVRVLGIARNVTRRKEAEDAAFRANAALLHASRLSVLGEVATTIAHEVNQPIGAAKNYLQAARCSIADPVLASVLDKVDAQLTRAADTVRKVRDFAAHRALEVRAEAVPALIHEACALGLLDAVERNVSVSLVVPDGLPPVVVDRVQIQQVLINLLRNAVEAMEALECGRQRALVISAAFDPAGARVEIAVADTGAGIPETVSNRLFTAFTTTKPNGTGLGLSTSRSIVEAHRGRLWVEDRAGGGTVFRLTLPIEEGEDD